LTEFSKTQLIRKVRHDKPQQAAQDTKPAHKIGLPQISSLALIEIRPQKLLGC
jgi:hypothetical protein